MYRLQWSWDLPVRESPHAVCLIPPQAVSRVREEGGGEGGGGGEREREEGMGVEHLCTALSHSLALWRHISNQCPPGHTSLSTHLQLVCRVSICVAQCLQRALAYSRSSKVHN